MPVSLAFPTPFGFGNLLLQFVLSHTLISSRIQQNPPLRRGQSDRIYANAIFNETVRQASRHLLTELVKSGVDEEGMPREFPGGSWHFKLRNADCELKWRLTIQPALPSFDLSFPTGCAPQAHPPKTAFQDADGKSGRGTF
jgi:hypothetical protein